MAEPRVIIRKADTQVAISQDGSAPVFGTVGEQGVAVQCEISVDTEGFGDQEFTIAGIPHIHMSLDGINYDPVNTELYVGFIQSEEWTPVWFKIASDFTGTIGAPKLALSPDGLVTVTPRARGTLGVPQMAGFGAADSIYINGHSGVVDFAGFINATFSIGVSGTNASLTAAGSGNVKEPQHASGGANVTEAMAGDGNVTIAGTVEAEGSANVAVGGVGNVKEPQVVTGLAGMTAMTGIGTASPSALVSGSSTTVVSGSGAVKGLQVTGSIGLAVAGRGNPTVPDNSQYLPDLYMTSSSLSTGMGSGWEWNEKEGSGFVITVGLKYNCEADGTGGTQLIANHSPYTLPWNYSVWTFDLHSNQISSDISLDPTKYIFVAISDNVTGQTFLGGISQAGYKLKGSGGYYSVVLYGSCWPSGGDYDENDEWVTYAAGQGYWWNRFDSGTLPPAGLFWKQTV